MGRKIPGRPDPREHEDKLMEDFPAFFPELPYCGITYEIGWDKLLRDLFTELHPFSGLVAVAQIKEKFGYLRCYVDFVRDVEGKALADQDKVMEVISKYESLSGKTCEKCGKAGTARKANWIRTLCDEHAEGKEVFVWPRFPL